MDLNEKSPTGQGQGDYSGSERHKDTKLFGKLAFKFWYWFFRAMGFPHEAAVYYGKGEDE